MKKKQGEWAKMRQRAAGNFVIQTTKPVWEDRTIKHLIDNNLERTYLICMTVGIVMVLVGLVFVF